MANKPVHVNEYVKDDGTYVREHYRGLPSSGGGDWILEGETLAQTSGEDIPFKLRPAEETSAQTLFGGVAENAEMTFDPVVEAVMQSLYNLIFEAGFQPENQADKKNTEFQHSGLAQSAKSIGTETGNIVAKSLNATSDALNTVELIRKYHEVIPSNALTGFEPQLDDAVLRMAEAQEEAEKSAQSTLQKLISTKDKTEYANLYHTYQQQREQNRLTKPLVTGIEYSVRNRNYEDMADFLIKLIDTQKEMLLKHPYTFMLGATTQLNKYAVAGITKGKRIRLDKRTVLHDFPEDEKRLISLGIKIEAIKEKAYDANELWKAAAYDFKQSDEYIKQNGYLLNSTSALPQDMRNFVRNKLEQQIGRREAKGILFKPDSTLSQDIVHGTELKSFVRKNLQKLLNHQIVNGSAYFGSTTNLKLALGHADIYNAQIDAEGNFRAFVIDTYDFNKDDDNWAVEWAHNVQENGLITNFYTINTIVIPKEELYNFIFL